jgi:hypothetical protein
MALSYFSQLPIIEYALNKSTNKKARDILHRLFFDQKFLDRSDYVRKYEVRDGDRPEIIANKLYGRPDLYSIIMLLNDFDTTMLSGLPPMSSIYNQYLDEKYSDSVYYLIPINTTLTAIGSGYSGGYVFPLLGYGFTIGEKIFGANRNFQNYDVRAYVKEWNPKLSGLKLDILSGSFVAGMTLVNEDGSIHYKIAHVKTGKQAVHHFEAIATTTSGTNPLIKGSIIDPLSRFDVIATGSVRLTPIGIYPGTDQFGVAGNTGSYGSSIIYVFNANGGSVLTSQKSYIKAVTNQEYEERLQERKRKINVPAPEKNLLSDLTTVVTDLLKSTGQ